jgi:polyferredoxin
LSVATVVFLLATLFFLDFGNTIPPRIISAVLALQLGPALVAAFGSPGLALFGILFVLATTLLVGRVYCSHLCPLGVLQDLFIWTAKKKYTHRKYPFSKPAYLIHYALSVIMIAAALAGSMLLLNLFEPFSNFGRILSDLVRPIIVLFNNAIASLLSGQRIYVLYEISLNGVALQVFVTTVLFLGGLFLLSFKYGRFFCNTICPVGGILSVLSRASLLRIVFKDEECIDCGLCERVCRARCVDAKNRRVDFAACVGCFDCISSCPTDGLSYGIRWKSSPRSEPLDTGRRNVLLSASTGMLCFLRAPQIPPATANEKGTPIVAPGGQSIERFTHRCTACQLCVSTCPSHVLQPSFLEFGLTGIMQPRMDYSINYCTYDCSLCGQVCPTGAIEPLSLDEKKLVQIGKAHFVKEDCIVETKKTDCGACSEHCPTKAVRMVPYGKLFLPEVDNQYCVGCGACEHACPTKPRKAIFVQSNAIHGVAKKRQDIKMEPAVSTPKDFPF